MDLKYIKLENFDDIETNHYTPCENSTFVYDGDDLIGFFTLILNKNGYYKLHCIEVFNQGKGYGTQIVKDILDKYLRIELDTFFDLLDFWKRFNVYRVEIIYTDMINIKLLKENYTNVSDLDWYIK